MSGWATVIETRWLSRWIQPRHFDAGALRGYQESFASHPARLVVLREFLQEEVAEKLRQFLTREAEFRTVYGLYSTNGEYVSEAEWLSATEEDRFFRFGKLAAVLPEFRLSPNVAMFLKFRQAIHEPAFRRFLEELAGIPLGSVTFNVHRLRRADFLASHDDDMGTAAWPSSSTSPRTGNRGTGALST